MDFRCLIYDGCARFYITGEKLSLREIIGGMKLRQQASSDSAEVILEQIDYLIQKWKANQQGLNKRSVGDN